MVRVWLDHAFRCLIPDREAFRGVVADPLMTGPAILIGAVGTAVLTLFMGGADMSDLVRVPLRVVGMVVTTLVLFGAGYLLTRKGSYAATVRAVGFAHVRLSCLSLLSINH